jgi:hypothetical protein
LMSICFHWRKRVNTCCLAPSWKFLVNAERHPRTVLHSLSLSCSVMLVNRCIRRLQYSNSSIKPALLRSVPLESSAMQRSTSEHQFCKMLSKWAMVSGSTPWQENKYYIRYDRFCDALMLTFKLSLVFLHACRIGLF